MSLTHSRVFRLRRIYDHFLFRLSCSSTSNRTGSVHVCKCGRIHDKFSLHFEYGIQIVDFNIKILMINQKCIVNSPDDRLRQFN